jgi:hypothetical protein
VRVGGWGGAPRDVRVIVGAQVVVLAYGTAVHVAQFVAGGLTPYGWAPAWLAAYFTALTVVDPLAAVLLLVRRATGLYLSVAILVTDAAANGYAVYGLHGGGSVAPVSQAVITLMAVAAAVTAPRVRPWLEPRRPSG